MLIGIRRGSGGGRRYIRRGLEVAPMNGFFPFHVAARQSLRKKTTVCCIGLFLLSFAKKAVFCDDSIVRLFRVFLSCTQGLILAVGKL